MDGRRNYLNELSYKKHVRHANIRATKALSYPLEQLIREEAGGYSGGLKETSDIDTQGSSKNPS